MISADCAVHGPTLPNYSKMLIPSIMDCKITIYFIIHASIKQHKICNKRKSTNRSTIEEKTLNNSIIYNSIFPN